jgi:hypothetical protein
MKDPVKEKMKRFGLMDRFGEDDFFATVEEAVGAFVATAGGSGDLVSGGNRR